MINSETFLTFRRQWETRVEALFISTVINRKQIKKTENVVLRCEDGCKC